MAPMTFVPEGDPSMMGGPMAIKAEGEVAEGGDQGFSGDPNDFADDAGASSLACVMCLIKSLNGLHTAGTFKSFGMMNPRGRGGGGPMRGLN